MDDHVVMTAKMYIFFDLQENEISSTQICRDMQGGGRGDDILSSYVSMICF